MTHGGIVGTVDPIAVALARLNPRNVHVPYVAVDLDELDARLRAVVVDQAEFDLGRHLGKECEVTPAPSNVAPSGYGLPGHMSTLCSGSLSICSSTTLSPAR